MRPPGHASLGAGRGSVVTLLAFPIGESGGIAAFARCLLASLGADHGGSFELVAPAASEPGWSTPLGQIRFAVRALRELGRSRPRAIQNHENLPLLAAALAHKLLVLGRVRVVHTVHVDPANRKPGWKRVLTGCLFALCDRVVVVSEDTKRRLGNIAHPVRRNVEVIYGAAPVAPRPSSDALAAFARSFDVGSGPVICQITRFYYPMKVKGAERLLQAFRLVRRAVPDAHLLLVGSGPLWETFRAEHGLHAPGEGVILTGFVDDPLVPMALADVYCHISFQDALPIVLLEAMSMGKAVVASSVGGVPEVLQDGVSGLLTSSSVEDLSRKLIGLLQAPEAAAALGHEAERQVKERFEWARCAAQYATLYGLSPGVAVDNPSPGVAAGAPEVPCGGASPATPEASAYGGHLEIVRDKPRVGAVLAGIGGAAGKAPG